MRQPIEFLIIICTYCGGLHICIIIIHPRSPGGGWGYYKKQISYQETNLHTISTYIINTK